MEDSFEVMDEEAPKKRRSVNILPLLGSLTPLFLIILTILYISIFQKDEVNDFLKKYDFIGISPVGKAEKNRAYQINNLDIPFEQRQALKQGTVFLGASRQMVLLALGQPASKPEKINNQEKWVYFFQDSSRPTYLFFENDKLVNAAKGTTVDNAEIQ